MKKDRKEVPMDFDKELFYKEFVQREDDFLRAPYNPEIEFYSCIKSGDVERVRELCKDTLKDKPGLGRLSNDPLQNLKYHFVITFRRPPRSRGAICPISRRPKL